MDVSSILQGVQEYLRYLQDDGVATVELPPDVMARLTPPAEAAPKPAPRSSAARRAPPGTEPPGVETQTEIPARSAPARKGSYVEGELRKITAAVSVCKKCPLHQSRSRAVPGQGSMTPKILFVGAAPDEADDLSGIAFSPESPAGAKLTEMIAAMGFSREEVFLGFVAKCRTPADRPAPRRDELQMCLSYLKGQVELLRPRVIVVLGARALQGMFPGIADSELAAFRGKWLSFEGVDTMPTFAPDLLLKDPTKKRTAWEDLKQVLLRLGLEIPTPAKRAKPE